MESTLLIGDCLLANKFIYGIREPFTNRVIIPISKPKRNDVIVFIYPVDKTKIYIKRVIGIPGDKIKISNRNVYVNNEIVRSKIKSKVNENLLIEVPENSYFVMGDNIDNSVDSRHWGFVPSRNLKGKAFIVYFSIDLEKLDTRKERIMMRIL